MEGEMKMLVGVMMVAMMAGMLPAMIQSTTPPPPPTYTCPICNEEFDSQQALYNHFLSSHPAEPIDIIWE